MPLLLYRYMLDEVLRVLFVTTAVLVTVIAFAAAIKPLTNDDLLSAGQTVKYVVLAMVPMMQFALPFSAGFAATVVLHRLTTDNEVSAAAASGLSYRRIVLPIVALGVVLGVIMVALTQSIIPMFWAFMHRTIATDATRLFESAIRSGRPFVLNDWQIYADQLRVVPHPSDTGAETRFVLQGVAAAKVNKIGAIVTDYTARQAVVDIHRRGNKRFLKLVLYEQRGFDAETGQAFSAPVAEPIAAVALGDSLKDDGVFMSRSKLLHFRAHPDEFSDVAESRDALAAALRELQVWDHVDGRLREQGTIELKSGDQRSCIVKADKLEQGVLSTNAPGPIEVTEFDAQGASRRFVAAAAVFTRSRQSTPDVALFDLSLTDVEITDFRTGMGNRGAQRTLPALSLQGLPPDAWRDRPSAELLAAAAPEVGRTQPVEVARWKLQHEIDSLQWDITARLHQRYALSATAPLLLILGAIFAMWLRNSLPLTIYLWAFAPSIADLILISGGYQLMRDGFVAGGAAVLWSGNALLAGVLVFAYARLARN